eukprot:CAMPEP_0182469436 /NCGR_PEP_ID=MMETSP1319-20130603/17092_1 /TAXON_ID=172717 /ORGANISM="Bolidomonas pacifica, Strain RCC208" /LENGTH=34 /DNA_ID= /DNA_START= /DNA_END= /DNA_ORIENTATION=
MISRLSSGVSSVLSALGPPLINAAGTLTGTISGM